MRRAVVDVDLRRLVRVVGKWRGEHAPFGAGTCVFMLLFGLLGTFLPKQYNKYLLKGSTILIVALGLSLMTKGIRLLA